jgi:hypothetical protein
MRVTHVKRKYLEFVALHDKLRQEYAWLPELPLPELSFALGLAPSQDMLKALAKYINVTFRNIAGRGRFSPRLMQVRGRSDGDASFGWIV